MSQTIAYEDLTSADKLVKSIHFQNGLGPNFRVILEAVQHQLDELNNSLLNFVKKSNRVEYAYGTDLDKIASFHSIDRIGMNDDSFRSLIENYVRLYETVTRDAIIDMVSLVTGVEPYVVEEFETRFYEYGEHDDTEAGQYSLIFNIPLSVIYQLMLVELDGISVVVENGTVLQPAIAECLEVGPTDTTIPISGDPTGEFLPEHGEIKIDNEYISYGSLDLDTYQFLNCVRGLYDSEPATHYDGAIIYEAINNAWLHGSNDSIFGSVTGNTFNLIGGPYPVGTRVTIRYKTEPSMTESELINIIGSLKTAGINLSAAGVKVMIAIGKILESYQSETMEELFVDDGEIIKIIGLGFYEGIQLPQVQGLFTESSDWDESLWNTTKWDAGDLLFGWDDNQWGSGEWDSLPTPEPPSGDYYLLINVSLA